MQHLPLATVWLNDYALASSPVSPAGVRLALRVCVGCCRDQDDYYGFFAGEHAMVQSGYGSIINRLADGLDVQLGHTVNSIAYHTPGHCTVISTDQYGDRSLTLHRLRGPSK